MKPFTIIANNCWSNKVYEHLNVPYQTPLISMFMYPDHYLRMVKRLRWYLEHPICAWLTDTVYPIAIIDDVEVHCLHYETTQEVIEKWFRRRERVVTDESRLFFKFCDQNGCTQEQLEEFDALPYPNKVCYTSKPMPHLKSAVYIPGGEEVSFQDQTDNRHFDAIKWVTQ